MVELLTFVLAAAIVLGGGLGVILSRNPVHAALSLVASLFGIAVLFVAQEAHFLAAVQVIVYTGAIVVLILFVLMLLGVDKEEDVSAEPIAGQRPVAIALGALGLVAIAAVMLVPVIFAEDAEPTLASDPFTGEVTETPPEDPSFENRVLTGQRSVSGALTEPVPVEDGGAGETTDVATDTDIRQLGTSIFTDYVFAFEVTALLLTVAVVGAVMLARRVKDPQDLPPAPDVFGAGDGDEPRPEVADA